MNTNAITHQAVMRALTLATVAASAGPRAKRRSVAPMPDATTSRAMTPPNSCSSIGSVRTTIVASQVNQRIARATEERELVLAAGEAQRRSEHDRRQHRYRQCLSLG